MYVMLSTKYTKGWVGGVYWGGLRKTRFLMDHVTFKTQQVFLAPAPERPPLFQGCGNGLPAIKSALPI